MPGAAESTQQRRERAEKLFTRADKQQTNGNLLSGFRLLLAAAKLGDTGAQVNLGYTYDTAIGVRRNRDKAMYWYKKAYRGERGCGVAAANIGTIFRDENNDRLAVRWFLRAVHYGDIDANLDLAKIYLKDPRHFDKARNCLSDMLEATPPIGVGEDTQREARKLLRKMTKHSAQY